MRSSSFGCSVYVGFIKWLIIAIGIGLLSKRSISILFFFTCFEILSCATHNLMTHHHSIFLSFFNRLLLFGLGGISYYFSSCLSLNYLFCFYRSSSISDSRRFAAILFNNPIIHIVSFITILMHNILEKFSKVVVVWLLFELQISAISEVFTKLFW